MHLRDGPSCEWKQGDPIPNSVIGFTTTIPIATIPKDCVVVGLGLDEDGPYAHVRYLDGSEDRLRQT